MSGRIGIALLAGVAVAVAGIATDAAAAGRGGGGWGGGGGGGFHGGGGGGFHGGGGGFHASGGGFHGGGPYAGGFHGFASHGFAGRSLGYRSLAGHSFAGHGFAGHAFAAHRNATRFGAGNVAGARNGLALHNQPSGINAAAARGQFAHNQFAATHFQGLHNFNRAGFNRNAFGNGSRWNRWGGRFWGAGWNNWGWGWGGWAGPVFWPFLYGDIFTFAFWPYDYYDPFWAYGPDFVLVSIFAPGPYYEGGYGPGYYGYAGAPDIYYGTRRAANPTVVARTNAEAVQSCTGLAPGVTDFPIAQIRKTVRPTADQGAALDALGEAATRANDVVKTSCPTAISLTPVARLDAAEGRLEAMIQAVQIVRGPLEKFSDSLSEEQKQRFDTMGSSGRARGSGAPGGDLAALCGRQASDVTKLPVQRIEQVVQPTAQQQDAFDALKKASENTASQLQASCPAQMPQTPVARLDAVNMRLTAIVEAMKTVRPKLESFYASLSDEQKAKFNTMGPPESASSSPEGQNRGQ